MSSAKQTADFRAKTEDQLNEEVLKLRREQMNLRFQRANGQLENPGRIRSVRKAIAKIKTIQSETRLKQGEKR